MFLLEILWNIRCQKAGSGDFVPEEESRMAQIAAGRGRDRYLRYNATTLLLTQIFQVSSTHTTTV